MAAELLQAFMLYARAAGAQVLVAGSDAEAAQIVAGIASPGIKCTRAVSEQYPGFIQALAGSGIPFLEVESIDIPGRSDLAVSLAGSVGIVRAEAGVAETGSLILADNALAPRLLSMLADICVVLVSESSLLRNLDDAARVLSKLTQEGYRYVSLVSGPSRTADIERVLTIGVQGPKALHIIVLAEKGG